MTNSKNDSVGIFIENCKDATVTGNRVAGFDRGISVVGSPNLHASDNTVISPETSAAILSQDAGALMQALGLSTDIKSDLVAEALQQYSESMSDLDKAAEELRESKLATALGAAADLTTISQAFYAIIQSGKLQQVLAMLFA